MSGNLITVCAYDSNPCDVELTLPNFVMPVHLKPGAEWKGYARPIDITVRAERSGCCVSVTETTVSYWQVPRDAR